MRPTEFIRRSVSLPFLGSINLLGMAFIGAGWLLHYGLQYLIHSTLAMGIAFGVVFIADVVCRKWVFEGSLWKWNDGAALAFPVWIDAAFMILIAVVEFLRLPSRP